MANKLIERHVFSFAIIYRCIQFSVCVHYKLNRTQPTRHQRPVASPGLFNNPVNEIRFISMSTDRPVATVHIDAICWKYQHDLVKFLSMFLAVIFIIIFSFFF